MPFTKINPKLKQPFPCCFPWPLPIYARTNVQCSSCPSGVCTVSKSSKHFKQIGLHAYLQFKNRKIHFAFNRCPYVGQGGLFWMSLSSMMEDGDENHMLCRAAASVPQGHGAINAPSPLPGEPAWSAAARHLLQSQTIGF